MRRSHATLVIACRQRLRVARSPPKKSAAQYAALGHAHARDDDGRPGLRAAPHYIPLIEWRNADGMRSFLALRQHQPTAAISREEALIAHFLTSPAIAISACRPPTCRAIFDMSVADAGFDRLALE